MQITRLKLYSTQSVSISFDVIKFVEKDFSKVFCILETSKKHGGSSLLLVKLVGFTALECKGECEDVMEKAVYGDASTYKKNNSISLYFYPQGVAGSI